MKDQRISDAQAELGYESKARRPGPFEEFKQFKAALESEIREAAEKDTRVLFDLDSAAGPSEACARADDHDTRTGTDLASSGNLS